MRIASLTLYLAITALWLPSQSQAKDVLHACGHQDYPPWNWLQDGEIVGVCATVAETLFANIGVAVNLKYVGPWKRCQQAVQNGAVDINICAFKNAQRQQYSDFAKHPMGLNENAIFVTKDKPFHFSKLADLSGKSIALVHGVSLGTEIDQYLTNNNIIFRVGSQQTMFAMLPKRQIDAAIFSREVGKILLSMYKLEQQIIDLEQPLVVGKLYISMSKQSRYKHLLAQLNSQLAAPDYMPWVESLFDQYAQKYLSFANSQPQQHP